MSRGGVNRGAWVARPRVFASRRVLWRTIMGQTHGVGSGRCQNVIFLAVVGLFIASINLRSAMYVVYAAGIQALFWSTAARFCRGVSINQCNRMQ